MRSKQSVLATPYFSELSASVPTLIALKSLYQKPEKQRKHWLFLHVYRLFEKHAQIMVRGLILTDYSDFY